MACFPGSALGLLVFGVGMGEHPQRLFGKKKKMFVCFFFSALELELRAFTLSHSTSPISVKSFSR
jgi:hypothetical protein